MNHSRIPDMNSSSSESSEEEIEASREERDHIKDITKSLVEIVQYSKNYRFRNMCYEAMNVDCTEALEEQIDKKLRGTCKSRNKSTFNIVTPKKQVEKKKNVKDDTWFSIAAKQTKNTPIKTTTPPLSEMQNVQPSTSRWAQSNMMSGPEENFVWKTTCCQMKMSPASRSPQDGFSRPDCSNTMAEHLNYSPLKPYDRRNDVPGQTRRVLFSNEEEPPSSDSHRYSGFNSDNDRHSDFDE